MNGMYTRGWLRKAVGKYEEKSRRLSCHKLNLEETVAKERKREDFACMSN
jgi:hypothetical protein